MTRFLTWLLFFPAIYQCTAQNSERITNGGDDPDRYLIVLSMDGFRWDIAGNCNTPTLDSIREAGTYAEVFPCFPSNTFPNHYTMATGLHPDNHGIVNNTFLDKPSGRFFMMSDRDAVSDAYFWAGEPIWNTAERQGLLVNMFMWVGSEAPVNGRYASVWTRFDSKIPFRERADWVIDAFHRDVDSIPNLVMWYLEEPDAIGHRHSSLSVESFATVESIDSLLRYFLEGMESSPVRDRINFIFTSDHGMASQSPDRYINLYPYLDEKRIRGYITSTPLFLEPDEDYIEETISILEEIPHIAVFHRDRMPEKYHYGKNKDRISPVIILPETGWVADYSETDKPRSGGGHGYDPFDRDMHMVFYGMGPDFRRDHVHPTFQNVNLYELMALLLAIDPAPNDGDRAAVAGMLNQNR